MLFGLAFRGLDGPLQAPGRLGVAEAGPEVEGTASFPIKNPIDKFILAALREAKLQPSARCTDEEFVRRVYLDVVGVIPTRAAVKAFLRDRSPRKRPRLVERLLRDERYGYHWAVMWGDLLREHTNSRPQEGTIRGSYRDWIRKALNDNMPYDRFVTALLTASGRADQNGAANFYLRDGNNRVETVNTVATVFMGTRLQCAQCHDHPFDKWEQKNFHQVMAFFQPRTAYGVDENATLARLADARRMPSDIRAKIRPYIERAQAALKAEAAGRGNASLPGARAEGSGGGRMMMKMGGNKRGTLRRMVKEVEKSLGKKKADRLRQLARRYGLRRVFERKRGDYRMPGEGDSKDRRRKTGEVVAPVFPWDPSNSKKPAAGESRRVALARFVSGSRRFAQVQANRLWARLMGRGLVDPVDDFRKKNPPTHPELLEYLTEELIQSHYDSKHLLRLILTSSAYERSSQPTAANRSDAELYSHQRVRRMTAEQIYDSLLVASGEKEGLKIQALSRGVGGRPSPSLTSSRRGRASKKRKRELPWAYDLPTPARTGSFMNIFNQSDREHVCLARDESGSITQALEMLNGSAVNDRVVARGNNQIQRLLAAGLSSEKIARELYLAAFARAPKPAELKIARIMLKGTPPPRELVEDFFWALLNAREFIFIK